MILLTFLIMILLFVFLVGLCVGSFLNVVISRAFSNESIVLPRSKCPSCNTPLRWYHNIPVLSYLFLKGKCAFCKDLISFQYPIVELITGIIFVAVFIHFGITLNSLFILFFSSVFIILAATDIREKVVFDFHTYGLIITGLIYNFFNVGNFYAGEKIITIANFSIGINNSFIASVIGVIVGIIVMELFANLGHLIAGTRAFGEGDTYIAAGLGAIFGWRYLITVLFYSFIIQVFLTLPVFLKKLYANKDYQTLIAFIAFLGVVLLMRWLDYMVLLNEMTVSLVFTIILCILAVYLAARILISLKNKKAEEMTYLPFGPAMVIAGFLMFFFM